ncbi:unnamed protein product [Cuscuta europaea]|uniref:Transposase (putative) gypsy type domain-containing protein n=1 Tax=Cuscuta europaea TaxID=41803 RepID=A0A9P1EBK0_CUSEU|nr:unnamed protein product [Cuscuta europaea]
MKSLNEEYYPYDDEVSAKSLDYGLVEEFYEEIEDLSSFESGGQEDEEGKDEEAASSSEGEDIGISHAVDGASTSATIPCPEPVSVVKGKAPVRRTRRPKNGPGFSYLDLTNIYIIRLQSNAGEYLVAQMYVGPFGRVRAPRPTDHVLNPPAGYFGVYPMSFTKGLQFPLHPFITEYLDMVGLPPALMTPNSYSLIVGFLLRCAELDFRPTTALFMSLYEIGRGSHKNCSCYATLQQIHKRRSFTYLPSSIHGWKNKFVFVSLGKGGTEFPSAGHSGRFNLHALPKSSILDAQVAAFLKGGPRSVKTYITEYKMAALGFMRYFVYADKKDDVELWPKMTTTYEEADGPDLGVPAEADGFVMDRMSFMKRAQLKASEELKTQQAVKSAADVGQPATAPATKPPVQKKKKRSADEGQEKLTEADLKPTKKSNRASPAGDDAGALTVPSGGEGGSNADALVDLTSGPSSTTVSNLPLSAAAPWKKGSGRELAKGTYKLEVEYPVKGGLFNEIVDGHEVISQAIPDEDRAYLKKLGNVKIYDGGMDHIVQGAFMLMENNRRQQREIARLK